MARNFMGLNAKDCNVVKEEPVEGGCEDSGIKMKLNFLASANSVSEFLGGNLLTAPASKPSNSSSPQLTIFYNGTVNVFDDISPEKVQAIISLAANGCVSSSNMARLKTVSSHTNIDASAANTDMKLSNTPRMVPLMGSMISSAIPQARKASLARFLERRRERVMNASSPYKMSKKPNECGTPDSTGSVSTSK